jgi:hypothetical protein
MTIQHTMKTGGQQVANDLVAQQPNISALARQTGLSRSTIRRRLANGWQPEPMARAEIILPDQCVTTPATPVATPAGHRGRGLWQTSGRAFVGLVVAGSGVAIAYTSITANWWFGHALAADPTAGEIFGRLSVLAEVVACVLPTVTRFYWEDGDRGTALRSIALMMVALVVVFFSASGFILTNISKGIEVRGERVTPAVQLAQRAADTLAVSRADECRKRGDRCRSIEDQERAALTTLAAARAEVRVTADPQAQALHVDPTTMHTVQAGAMVLMCLCSGFLIALGAGLIWSRTNGRP